MEKWVSILSAVFLLAGGPAMAEDDWGVLVMAHGGSPAWNDTVLKTVGEAGLDRPVEVFFGMAAMSEERDALAAAELRLKKRGARRILAVPLLVSSHSEVYRQYEYMLGLRAAPGFTEEEIRLMGAMHGGGHGAHAHGGPHRPLLPLRLEGTPVFLAKALDDSPELVRMLKDRLDGLSRARAGEAVVLVAHGPNDEGDNRRWEETLERVAADVTAGRPFAGRAVVTLREDAPAPVKDAATRRFRGTVEDFLKAGRRVVVLPVLISAGGIERGVAARLKGLDVSIAGPLLPHPAAAVWLRRKAAERPR